MADRQLTLHAGRTCTALPFLHSHFHDLYGHKSLTGMEYDL